MNSVVFPSTAFKLGAPLRSPFSVPLTLALALAYPAVQAQPSVLASGSFTDGSDYLSSAKAGAFDQPATIGAFDVAAVGAPISAYDSSTSVRAVSNGQGQFGTAIANDKIYGSQASMTANVHVSFSDSLVNTSGSTQAASFALNISNIAFSVFTGTESGTNRGSFQAQVFVGSSATPVFSSAFSFDNIVGNGYGGNGMAGSSSGTDLGLTNAFNAAFQNVGIFNSFNFGISNFATTLALGNVAAGDTLAVRYVVDIAAETTTYGGHSSVSFADPAGLSAGGGAGQPASAVLGFATPVPEPDSAALLAAGLGLMAAAAARRRRG